MLVVCSCGRAKEFVGGAEAAVVKKDLGAFSGGAQRKGEGAARPRGEVRMPIRFSSNPDPVHRAAPTLGQNTREALREVGFSDAEIDAWKAERLV